MRAWPVDSLPDHPPIIIRVIGYRCATKREGNEVAERLDRDQEVSVEFREAMRLHGQRRGAIRHRRAKIHVSAVLKSVLHRSAVRTYAAVIWT